MPGSLVFPPPPSPMSLRQGFPDRDAAGMVAIRLKGASSSIMIIIIIITMTIISPV